MLLKNDDVELIAHTFIVDFTMNLIKVIHHELERREYQCYTSPYALKATNNYSGYCHRNSSGNGLPFILEHISNYVLLLLKFFDRCLY